MSSNEFVKHCTYVMILMEFSCKIHVLDCVRNNQHLAAQTMLHRNGSETTAQMANIKNPHNALKNSLYCQHFKLKKMWILSACAHYIDLYIHGKIHCDKHTRELKFLSVIVLDYCYAVVICVRGLSHSIISDRLFNLCRMCDCSHQVGHTALYLCVIVRTLYLIRPLVPWLAAQ